MIAKQNGANKGWTFRREITFGVLLQLAVVVVMALAGWVNLQKQLAIIQHDLGPLLQNTIVPHRLTRRPTQRITTTHYQTNKH